MKQDTLFLPLVLICLATMVLLFKGKPSGNHTSKSFLSEYREHTRLIHKATSGDPGVYTTKQLKSEVNTNRWDTPQRRSPYGQGNTLDSRSEASGYESRDTVVIGLLVRLCNFYLEFLPCYKTFELLVSLILVFMM